MGESIESATIREVKEETNVDLTRADIDQFRVFSDPQRDQRRHTVSNFFLLFFFGFYGGSLMLVSW